MKLIDKAAVVAEIERRKKELIKLSRELIESSDAFANQWACGSLDNILSFLDTIEVKEYSEEYDGFLGKELKMVDDEIERLEKLKVKEVDFEKVWKEYLGYSGDVSAISVKPIAKHFFKLGMRVNNKAQKEE